MTTEAQPVLPAWERDHTRTLRAVALAFVALGLAWRATRYALAFPVWGDEAFLLLNYPTRGFADLLGPIDHCQIAPLLFHAAELAAVRLLGPSEWAVRLPAFLACVASLPLFWRLARLLLSPLGHTLAVAVFAVSVWPATMGALVKPYAFDLFFSLALLVPAVTWILRPDRVRPLVILAAVAPVAILASYPAAFVGGAVGLMTLAHAYRCRDRRAVALVGLYGVLLVAAFAWHYYAVARPHLASAKAGVSTAAAMDVYWRDGFPPAAPLAFVAWYVRIHTGQMAAYPLGTASGGSGLTVLVCLIGMGWLWTRQRRFVVGLSLATFGLWFAACLLRKYPYGLSCRLSQHVAPFYCLLAGAGLAVLVARCKSPGRACAAVAVLLGLVGVGGTVRDVAWPYRDEATREARAVLGVLKAKAGGEPIFAAQPQHGTDVVFQWYLGQHAGGVVWGDDTDWEGVARARHSLWLFGYADDSADVAAILPRLEAAAPGWQVVERRFYLLRADNVREPFCACRYYHLVRPDGSWPATPGRP